MIRIWIQAIGCIQIQIRVFDDQKSKITVQKMYRKYFDLKNA